MGLFPREKEKINNIEKSRKMCFSLTLNITKTAGKLTWAAQPGRLATWSIRLVSLNQSTATRSIICFPAGILTMGQKIEIRGTEEYFGG